MARVRNVARVGCYAEFLWHGSVPVAKQRTVKFSTEFEPADGDTPIIDCHVHVFDPLRFPYAAYQPVALSAGTAPHKSRATSGSRHHGDSAHASIA